MNKIVFVTVYRNFLPKLDQVCLYQRDPHKEQIQSNDISWHDLRPGLYKIAHHFDIHLTVYCICYRNKFTIHASLLILYHIGEFLPSIYIRA